MIDLFPRMTEKVQQWAFNGKFGKNFENVFDLQMWCLGCDIRREKGNLLLQYGFERYRPHGKISGSSHYIKRIDSNHTIHLWGFAVVVTNDKYGLCLRRHERIPRLAIAPRVASCSWRPHDLPLFIVPKSSEQIEHANKLLGVAAAELGRYEKFVDNSLPVAYRKECLTPRRSHKKLSGATLMEAWEEFNRKLEGVSYATV